MNLGIACNLLGHQGRIFADVYKLYGFKDEQSLKDYLEFVVHEPVEWLKGFPVKLNNKASFGKPKTALIKLLKESAVVEALGQDYTNKVHEVVWNAFKKHADEIIAKRAGHELAPENTILHQLEEDDAVVPTIEDTIAEDAESVHSVKKPRRFTEPEHPTINWQAKYVKLHEVVIQLVEAHKDSPLYGAFKVLLQQ